MKKKSVYWKWWWKQVEKGLVPECAYRMVKIRDSMKDNRR